MVFSMKHLHGHLLSGRFLMKLSALGQCQVWKDVAKSDSGQFLFELSAFWGTVRFNQI